MARQVLTISQANVRFGDVPVGGAVDPALLTDYGCQVTKAAITASTNTVDVPATFCEPAGSIAVSSSFSLDVEGLQDWAAATPSFSEWLFLNDGTRKAFALYLNGQDDPVATGIVSVAAGDFGGSAGEILTFTGSFPILGYPTITNAGGSSIRPDGSLPIAATGASSGTPGTFTPSGSTPPGSLAAAASLMATPGTAWSTGEYVVLGDASEAYWDGTDWVEGRAT